jgi:hypothetical protein
MTAVHTSTTHLMDLEPYQREITATNLLPPMATTTIPYRLHAANIGDCFLHMFVSARHIRTRRPDHLSTEWAICYDDWNKAEQMHPPMLDTATNHSDAPTVNSKFPRATCSDQRVINTPTIPLFTEPTNERHELSERIQQR